MAKRRSPKEVMNAYINELLNRAGDPHVVQKLLALETFAFRMGWNDIYNRLRFRTMTKPDSTHDTKTKEPEEKWWQK